MGVCNFFNGQILLSIEMNILLVKSTCGTTLIWREKNLGTEIHTFTSLKELTEFLVSLIGQYRMVFEDYSQWLGSMLRDFEATHKNEEWYQKCAALQKNLRNQPKKVPETKEKGKKKGKNAKGNKDEVSCWVQSGDIWLSFTEQGQTEILFEAIEKINEKIQEIDRFKGTVQQLSRLGLGMTVNYIVYLEEDVPKKIVLKSKANLKEDEVFKFNTELSVPAFYSSFDNK